MYCIIAYINLFNSIHLYVLLYFWVATESPHRNMQLRRLYLRYFPPGLRLEYVVSSGEIKHKTIDLLNIRPDTNIQLVINHLLEKERLFTKATVPKLKELLQRLIAKQITLDNEKEPYRIHSILRPHPLPITNFTYNKSARIVATSSYDKTIRLFQPFQKITGVDDKNSSLQGHEGIVYCVSMNRPHSNLLLSGSFDRTCRIWDIETKTSKAIYKGHEGEVVSAIFNGTGETFGSCSMDCTAIIWDVEAEKELYTLTGHTAEVSCLAFDSKPHLVATGSCDSTVRLWDVRYGACFRSLEQHDADISTLVFDYQSNLLASTSVDHTCKVWDVRTGKCLFDLDDHKDEVNDVAFNSTGALVVTAGKDGKAFVYDTLTGTRRCELQGHSKAISKVCFNMQGSRILTSSADHTARLWDIHTGECIQVLEGHEEEIFSCGFSYDGQTILTASKDNSLRIWKMMK
jgi:dynein assembly factor with WDR repeat domains 1